METKLASLTVGTAIAAMASVAGAQAPSADSLRRVLSAATFVFDGTVVQRNATADSAIAPTRRTALVRVNRALVCPADIGDFSGELVTVTTLSDTDPPVGTQRWFFASGWMVSDRLALESVALIPGTSGAARDAMIANLKQVIDLDSAAEFRFRVTSAALAAVVTIRTYAPAGYGEHRGAWWLARATIDSVIPFVRRGNDGTRRTNTSLRGQEVAFLISTADRFVLQFGAQHVEPGTTRVALLQRIAQLPGAVRADSSATFYAPDAASVRPMTDLQFLGSAAPTPGFLYVPPVAWCAGSP